MDLIWVLIAMPLVGLAYLVCAIGRRERRHPTVYLDRDQESPRVNGVYRIGQADLSRHNAQR